MSNRKPLLAGLTIIAAVFFASGTVMSQDAAPAEAAPAAAQAEATPAAAPADAAPATAPAAEGAPAAAPAEAGAAEATALPGGELSAPAEVNKAWKEFVHYVTIGQVELATSSAQWLIDTKSPINVYLASIQDDDADVVIARAAKIDSKLDGTPGPMKEKAEAINKMILDGYGELHTKASHIARAIDRLGGSLRAAEEARKFLLKSGEFALPQLLGRLVDGTASDRLKERVINLLPAMGKESVRGLSAALESDDIKLVEIVGSALGQIKYYHAAPALRIALERKDLLPSTKSVLEASLVSCCDDNPNALKKSVAEICYDVALKYYYRHDSVVPDARYDTANVWRWKGKLLDYVKVPREIFCDVYTMRLCRQAIDSDGKYYPAISVWINAGFLRELHLPEGKSDPLKTPATPPHIVNVMASSPKYVQESLSRALTDQNSALAVQVITALGRTQGDKSLVASIGDGVQPVVSAMSYPDRLVRYLAAETLAMSLPQKSFAGDQMVMYTLNDAIKQSGRKTALLVVADEQKRNIVKASLRAADIDVIDQTDPMKFVQDATNGGGADIVVLGGDPDPVVLIPYLRQEVVFQSLPVLVLADGPTIQKKASDDKRTLVAGPVYEGDIFNKALADAFKLGAGQPFTPEDAAAWSIRAAKAVRQLGLTKNTIFRFADARIPLENAMKPDKPEVCAAAAQALAVMPLPEAQRAIINIGLSPETPEDLKVILFNAATESVRMFGGMAKEDQAKALIQLVTTEATPVKIREASAQLLGSLNLPSDQIQGVIKSSKPID